MTNATMIATDGFRIEDRRRPRLPLRRRIRDLAGLRFPHRRRGGEIRAAGTARTEISGSGSSAHLHASSASRLPKDIVIRSRRHQRATGARLGHRHGDRLGREIRICRRPMVGEWSSLPLAQRTPKKLLNDSEDATLLIAVGMESPSPQPAALVRRFSRGRRRFPREVFLAIQGQLIVSPSSCLPTEQV